MWITELSIGEEVVIEDTASVCLLSTMHNSCVLEYTLQGSKLSFPVSLDHFSSLNGSIRVKLLKTKKGRVTLGFESPEIKFTKRGSHVNRKPGGRGSEAAGASTSAPRTAA